MSAITRTHLRLALILPFLLTVQAGCVPQARDDASPQPTPRSAPAAPRAAQAASQSALDEMASRFVDAHNAWRREVGVPDIGWSTELEQRARGYAETLRAAGCPLEHDTDEFGENLYSSSAKPGPPSASAEDAVDSWGSERADYSYEHNTCRPGAQCGHYTQMVWSDTRHVGCASASCSLADGWQTVVWVCKYDPAGNYVGERPY